MVPKFTLLGHRPLASAQRKQSLLPTPVPIPVEDLYLKFLERLKVLKVVSKNIPQTVSLATKKDHIYEVFQKIPIPENIEEQWEIFNLRMDLLFGEDVCGSDGRLSNFRRGTQGIDLVIQYLETEAKAKTLLWDLARIKVDRLIDKIMEIKYILLILTLQKPV